MSAQSTFALCGEITFDNVRSQRQRFFNSIDLAPERFVVDLSGINKMDSAGLALLIDGMNKTKQLGKHMKYCQMPELYKKLVTFYDLDGVITF